MRTMILQDDDVPEEGEITHELSAHAEFKGYRDMRCFSGSG